MRGLLIVDVQNDFCEGGALAVQGGHDVARTVARLLEGTTGFYPMVFTSQDWHRPLPDLNGGHFAEPGTDPDFVTSWPVHCVQGTRGAELHDDLHPALRERLGRWTQIQKGDGRPDYSAFRGVNPLEIERRGLDFELDRRGVTSLDVVGLATDYCVYQSAIDALRIPQLREVRVIEDLCAGVGTTTVANALDDLRNLGAQVITTEQL
jgi:nicotinamidase/pyrazinamidase